MKTIDIHGKPYVMVKDRLMYFHETYPTGKIITKMLHIDDKMVVFSASIWPDMTEQDRFFTGHAEEHFDSSQINSTSAVENCETSAIGRCLGTMGIGVEESFASADEVANAVNQQNGESKVTQNTPETPKNDLVCPECDGVVVDKRVWENGEWTRQTSPKGKKFPAFQCIDNDDFKNPTCKGVIWDVPENALQRPPDVLVDDENLAEAERMAQDAEDIPF